MARLNRKDMQQQTRQRLLAAAQEEIVRKGLGKASVRDIAEAAGYSLGAFYSNFKSKEAMLEELVDVHMREEIRIFREITSATGDEKKEDVLSKVSLWLKKLQINKKSSALTFELQMHANRNALFRKKFDNAKVQRLQELADGLRSLFLLNGLKPKMDFGQMALGFAAIWNGFSLQGNGLSAKPIEQVILFFLRALLDSSEPVNKKSASLQNSKERR